MKKLQLHFLQLFLTILFVIIGWNVCMAELQIYDDFDGLEINSSLWNKSDSGVLSQADGYLNADGPPSALYGNMWTTKTFTGDFDIILDYRDFATSATSSSWNLPSVSLQVMSSVSHNDHVHIFRGLCLRDGLPGRKVFFSNGVINGMCQSGSEALATTQSGLLRIARQSSVITTYYDEGAGWTALKSFPDAFTCDVVVQIGSYTGDNGTFHAAFDWLKTTDVVEEALEALETVEIGIIKEHQNGLPIAIPYVMEIVVVGNGISDVSVKWPGQAVPVPLQYEPDYDENEWFLEKAYESESALIAENPAGDYIVYYKEGEEAKSKTIHYEIPPAPSSILPINNLSPNDINVCVNYPAFSWSTWPENTSRIFIGIVDKSTDEDLSDETTNNKDVFSWSHPGVLKTLSNYQLETCVMRSVGPPPVSGTELRIAYSYDDLIDFTTEGPSDAKLSGEYRTVWYDKSPWTSYRSITFSRDGSATCADMETSDGDIDSSAMTYTVCGHGALTINMDNGHVAKGMVSADRNVIHFIDNNTVGIGVGIRASSGMSAADLNGEYRTVWFDKEPCTSFGKVAFDGNCSGNYQDLETSDGSIPQGTLTYFVEDDGTLTINMDDGHVAKGMINANRNIIHFIAVVSG